MRLPSSAQRQRPVARQREGGASPWASEHQEAAAFFRMVRMHETATPALRWLYAIPNGGHRGKTTASRMKAEGVRPGVADYCLPVARGGFHGLFIELKTETGAPSREQREFIADMRAAGYRAEVARGWVEAWAIVCSYLAIENIVERSHAAKTPGW